MKDRYLRLKGGRTIVRESTLQRWEAAAQAHRLEEKAKPARVRKRPRPNARKKRRARNWAEMNRRRSEVATEGTEVWA